MTRFAVTGVILGIRSNPYSFPDKQTGEIRSGVSHRLVMFDQSTVEAIDLVVREDDFHLFGSFTEGKVETVTVDVRSNDNKLRVTAVPPEPAAVKSNSAA